MKGTGWTLLLLGIGLLLFAAIYDTTVDSDAFGSNGVYNLGKLQVQMMAWMAGLASSGLGIALVAASAIYDRAFRPATPANDACRWCGQIVVEPNTPCAELSPLQWEKGRSKIANPKCLAALAERGLSVDIAGDA